MLLLTTKYKIVIYFEVRRFSRGFRTKKSANLAIRGMDISLNVVQKLQDGFSESAYQNIPHENLIHATMFCLGVLNILWWCFEDRTNAKKASNLFALVTSLFCGISSCFYVLTHDVWYATVAHACFLSGIIMDFAYGYIFFPEYMDPLTTTVHHIMYMIMEIYLSTRYDRLAAPFSLFFPQEIPTFLLNLKRYLDIKDVRYEVVFGLTFFLLRILYYFIVSYMLRKDIMADSFLLAAFVGVAYMHISWFIDWSKKTYHRPFTVSKKLE